MSLDFLALIACLVLAAVAWLGWLRDRKQRRSLNSSTTSPAPEVRDERLADLQSDFERRLASESDLPDGIRGRQAYIYWQLMRHWFSALDADHRYEREKAQRLRRDWCDYIELLPYASTAGYLARETADRSKAATHARDAELALRRIELIQNAFAAAVGAEAVEKLRYVRDRSSGSFDRSGRLPIAPDGHHYFPTSFHPYVEECEPDEDSVQEPGEA